ncbi:MAG TPA: hypothetical protein VIK32_05055 [Candidatus Limnocylindrales bacterium]
MPENAKETRSSAAIKITARKNLREDGSLNIVIDVEALAARLSRTAW